MAEAAVTAMWSAFDPSSAAHTHVGGTAINRGVLFYTSVLRPGYIRDTVWNAVSFILSTATGCIFTGVVFYTAAAKPLQELCLFLQRSTEAAADAPSPAAPTESTTRPRATACGREAPRVTYLSKGRDETTKRDDGHYDHGGRNCPARNTSRIEASAKRQDRAQRYAPLLLGHSACCARGRGFLVLTCSILPFC